MINSWLIAARAAHFAACMLIFGVCVFDRFIARGRAWREVGRALLLFALPAALVSGAAWFALVTIDMSGSLDDWRIVLHQTSFGRVWELRAYVFAALCVAFVFSRWAALVFSGVLLGSLAWAGHGHVGRPPIWHLVADGAHLLTAGCWPAGLVPLAFLLVRLRRTDPSAILEITSRFSVMALSCVTVLTVSGLINCCYLLSSPADLLWTTYGRVLMVKFVLFVGMVIIGMVNILVLKPRLRTSPRAAGALQRNVWTEVILGTLIVCVVALLGLLPPALS